MRFEERQRFRQPWLWTILVAALLPALIPVYGAFQQIVLRQPFGSEPVSNTHLVVLAICVIAFAGLVLGLFGVARLDVTVDDSAVIVFFPPFHRRPRRFDLSDIAEAAARDYDPLTEYGGWGIRLGVKGWAYNVSGSRGVQLVLTNGKRILIGSQRADELEAAINGGRGGRRSAS